MPTVLLSRYSRAFLALFALFTLAAEAASVRIGGTGSAIGTMKAAAAVYQQAHPGTEIVIVPALGSGGGIKAVAAGALDIGLSGRPLKPDERAQNLSQIELARTPFVFASAKPHPGFTLHQIAQIYAGTLTSWPDGSPLRVILRPESDSETALLRAISPEMSAALSAAQARRGLHTAATDPDMADALEQIPGSIGSSTLALIVSERRRIKPLPLNHVSPGLETLAGGAYPYHKPLYLVTAPAVSAAARDFIAFLQSRAGAKLLARNGYLALG